MQAGPRGHTAGCTVKRPQAPPPPPRARTTRAWSTHQVAPGAPGGCMGTPTHTECPPPSNACCSPPQHLVGGRRPQPSCACRAGPHCGQHLRGPPRGRRAKERRESAQQLGSSSRAAGLPRSRALQRRSDALDRVEVLGSRGRMHGTAGGGAAAPAAGAQQHHPSPCRPQRAAQHQAERKPAKGDTNTHAGKIK